MIKAYEYGDIISRNILDLFPKDIANDISSYAIDDKNTSIDVSKIVKRLGIKIEITDIEFSGKLEKIEEDQNNTIYINEHEVSTRQRFTLAHELGHYLLSDNNSGVKKRAQSLDIGKYSAEERIEEISANNFAASLLMPQKLIVILVKDWLINHNNDSYEIDDESMDILIEYLGNSLEVSHQAIKIRMKVLGVVND